MESSWRGFEEACKRVGIAWPQFVDDATALDQLPIGKPCVNPLPGDIAAGFKRALTVEGQEPFFSSPKIIARRLSVVSTTGSGAMDVTGAAHTISDLSDFRP